MGKAKLTSTGADILKKINTDRKKQAGRTRADYSGVSVSSVGVGAARAGSSATNIQTYASSGGRISGAVSLFPKTIDVVSGVIDLTDETTGTGNVTKSTSNVNVIGADNMADTLVTINGNVDTGHMLFLKAAGYEITLQHGTTTNGLYCPGATDFVLGENEGAVLIYGGTGNYWTVLGPEGGAAGGASPVTTKGDIYTFSTVDAKLGVGTDGYFLTADSAETTGLKWVAGAETFDWTAAHRAGGNTLFLDPSDASNINSSVDNTVRIQTGGGGGTAMTWTDSYITSARDIRPTTTETLGTSSFPWDEAFIKKVTFGNNTTFSNTISAIGTESSGTVVINVQTTESFIVRAAAGKDLFEVGRSGANGVYIPSQFGGNDLTLEGGDIIMDNGDLTMTSGDIALANGNISLYDSGTSDSTLTLKYGIAALTDQKILSDNGGLEYFAASGNVHLMRVANTPIFGVDDLGANISDGLYLQPQSTSSDVIGIVPFRDTTLMTTVGSRGTNLTPTIESTTTVTDSQLNSWFGNGKGATGMVYDTSKATGSGRMRLYMKGSASTSSWRAVEFDINP